MPNLLNGNSPLPYPTHSPYPLRVYIYIYFFCFLPRLLKSCARLFNKTCSIPWAAGRLQSSPETERKSIWPKSTHRHRPPEFRSPDIIIYAYIPAVYIYKRGEPTMTRNPKSIVFLRRGFSILVIFTYRTYHICKLCTVRTPFPPEFYVCRRCAGGVVSKIRRKQ